MSRLRIFLSFIVVPATLLVGFGIFVAVYKLLGGPSQAQLIALAEHYYTIYGYLFVNWYLPGSAVIVLGVVFSSHGGLNVSVLVLLIVAGFWLTGLVNYALGR